MKKSIQILIILFCIVLTGCSSSKKLKEENILLKNEIQKRDSIKTTVINKAIEDKLITPIAQSQTGNVVFDSLVNAKVDEILSKLNTSKNSGDNNYKLIYDKFKKQLEFYAQIAQTKNENTAIKNEKVKTIIQIKKIPVVVEKPLSKLEKFLMGFGILALLYIGFKIIALIRKRTSI
jgi:PBP1b-binding outer membrane lipoprotein LpoB